MKHAVYARLDTPTNHFKGWDMFKRINRETLLKFIIFSFIMVTAYTVVAVIFQIVTNEELSPTLTTCFFAVFGGEVLSCALIKVFKLKKE